MQGKAQLLTRTMEAGVWERVRLVLILGALSAFAPISIDMYLPALPALGRDVAASASQVQLTLSSCLFGLAFGQVVAGPLSDTLGRRRPLLAGVALYTITSLLCGAAPSIGALIALRFVQGLAGGAGIVVAQAIVRDRYEGVAAARYFSRLMLVGGLSPILAPIIGGQLLRFTSWRGVFVVLATIGLLLFLAVAVGLRETLPPGDRHTGGMRTTLNNIYQLLADRFVVGCALASGLSFAAMFAYISGSPFVLQGLYRVSPQLYSILFGLNALGIMTLGQINGWLVGGVSPRRLLGIGLATIALGGLALLVAVSAQWGLAGILPALFVVVATQGIVGPNAAALVLSGQRRSAGSAAALLGLSQFVIGAATAPLVGLDGGRSALPMAAVIAALGVSSLVVFILLALRPSGSIDPE